MLTHRIVPERPSIGARVVLGLWLVAPVLAELHTPLPDGWDRGFGLQRLDGALLGLGPRYLVRFEPTGFALTPALGTAAPKARPLAFSLDSVWRGEARLYQSPREGVVPVEEGPFVRYDRGFLIESYEVRQDGIEQSFRFDALPPGTGDLVVRGRVRTELPAPPAGAVAEGLRFEVQGLGGVSIGAVTGIDADGRRAAGTLRFDGTFVELALPAAFVETAALPLVLDPLIGPSITITGADDRAPDVAYNARFDVYLAVWQRSFGASTRTIFVQRFSSMGELLGTPALIGGFLLFDMLRPTVANVNGTDQFLVVYQSNNLSLGSSQLAGRTVQATDGSLIGNTVEVAHSPVLLDFEPDLGGHTGALNDGTHAVVAYRTLDGLRARSIFVPRADEPVPGPTAVLSSNPDDRAPALPKISGGAGRFLVVWERLVPANGGRDLYAAAVNPTAGIIASPTRLSSDPAADEEHPACATADGTHFLVAYEKQPGGTADHHDVACRMVAFSPGTLTIGSESILAGGEFDQTSPCVDFAGPKALVGWRSTGGLPFQNGLYVRGFDRTTCAPCEPPVQFATSLAGVVHDFPEIAARYGGGLLRDEAMLVWEAVSSTEGPDVKARLVEALGGGPVVDLGGGCGAGGTASVNGPVAIGNPAFAFTLAGAPPGATAAVFNVNLPGAPVVCGSCSLTPFYFAIPYPLLFGGARFALPLPCELGLLGATVEVQWTVLESGSNPCPAARGASFSNRLQVTVGT
jgi:hypothetical protein